MADKIINENRILSIIERTGGASRERILEILRKARLKKGLDLEEAGFLVNLNDLKLLEELFSCAGEIKEEIYGERLVFFAPLYISDYCLNNCAYCNFHVSNTGLLRRRLTPDEIEEQTRAIINMGHKRILVECGEDPVNNGIDYVLKAIERIYATRTTKGSIRRINVNIAATSKENYRRLKQASIGTYQLFQETYHRSSYLRLHQGPKADYERQITAHCRAYEAGIDDLGIGVLFGLYDWRFETLGLISHARYLDEKYNVGPHTISVPRIQPAASVSPRWPYAVADRDFLKLIAILRLAVPYTGMIISTRESPRIRNLAFKIGISQASAASCTVTGGYGHQHSQAQFKLQDERPLDEVIGDIVRDGLLPSFCTACYRVGRTGEAFMNISKRGEIHNFCRPNGLLTFAEYLEDFCQNGIYDQGQALIRRCLDKIEDLPLRQETEKRLLEIIRGKRDIYF